MPLPGAVYLIVRDPQDLKRRQMLHSKNNLSTDERGFCYVVKTTDNEAPYIEWSTTRQPRDEEAIELDLHVERMNARQIPEWQALGLR